MSEETKEIVEKEIIQESDINIDENAIKSLIYVVRGQQVMLDSDLALLYQVETKALNRAVKRNEARFPEDFCFQITEMEYENLRYQFGTSSLETNGYGGRRYLPYVFTEQGIAMLSAVLRSDVAIQVSIKIMNTFVEMRHFMANSSLVLNRINEIVVFETLTKKELDGICRLMLSDIQKALEEKNISVSYTDNIVNYIIEKGFDEQYGARPMKRIIFREVENKIAELIISNAITEGDSIVVDANDDGVVVMKK